MKKITGFLEKPHRSLVKAITFRLVIVFTNVILVYLLTKRHDLTSGVVISQTILNTLIYIAHERVWNRIHWGKHRNKN